MMRSWPAPDNDDSLIGHFLRNPGPVPIDTSSMKRNDDAPGKRAPHRLSDSLALRGLFVTIWATIVTAIPLAWSYQTSLTARDRVGRIVSGALVAQLTDRLVITEGAPDVSAMQAALRQDERIRLAAVVSSEGRRVDLRNTLQEPSDGLVENTQFPVRSSFERGVRIDGRWQTLHATPIPGCDSTLILVLDDRTRAAAAGSVFLFVGLAIGIISSIAMFQALILKPVRRFTKAFAADGSVHGLAEGSGPRELTAIGAAFLETHRQLIRYRAHTRDLEHSLSAQLEARSRAADRAVRKAESEAWTDALTGLRNRRALEAELPKLVEEAGAREAEVALLYVDLDNFKHLNDRLGHRAGDELLQNVGTLLRSALRRGTDFGYRYGGDEFVLILPNLSATDALPVGKRIIALFKQRLGALPALDPKPGMSVGIASLRQNAARDAEQLLQLADTAMYHAKRHAASIIVYKPRLEMTPATSR